MPNLLYTGRCLCGAVRYECGEPLSATLCHCESCRRAAGANVVAWVAVRRDQFRFTAGEPRTYASSPAVTREFCGACGTQLTYAHRDDAENIDITIASLDEPSAIAPRDHTWMGDALSWDRPYDGLPQFRANRSAGERVDR